jgi:hypothetical protein
MRIRLISTAAMLGLATLAFSQAPESRGTATTTIAGKKVVIDYGQPVLKGRSFAELMKLLPPDRMWRAGSGIVTTINTETALLIGGKKVPAGKYSLYVHCPESGDHALVLNSDLGQPLSKIWPAAPPSQANDPYPSFSYTKEIASKEVARVPMKKVVAPVTDVLTYDFQPSSNGTLLRICWGDQAWALQFQAAK